MNLFRLSLFLFEIFHGNIGPGIPAKINKDIVDSFYTIEMCSQVIIVFYLRSELLPVQPELFNKFITEFYPVYFRKSYMMCIEVARCPAKFPGERDAMNCSIWFSILSTKPSLLFPTLSDLQVAHVYVQASECPSILWQGALILYSCSAAQAGIHILSHVSRAGDSSVMISWDVKPKCTHSLASLPPFFQFIF
jgi:hypothetical protein